MWEKYYVPRQLLAKVNNMTDVGRRYAERGDQISNCTIAVVRNREGSRPTVNRALIEMARKRGLQFAVVVLGDEWYTNALWPLLIQ